MNSTAKIILIVIFSGIFYYLATWVLSDIVGEGPLARTIAGFLAIILAIVLYVLRNSKAGTGADSDGGVMSDFGDFDGGGD